MVVRILTALVGGAVITTGMLLGMHEATKHFKDKDPTRYFGIVDFIPAPEDRSAPEPPPKPQAPPERPRVPYEPTDAPTLPVEQPQTDGGAARRAPGGDGEPERR